MTYEEIIRELESLPPEEQQEAADFIASLHDRHARSVSVEQPERNLSELKFVGMWRDREDMHDSTAWVRHLREHEWIK
ncbi:MAG TPA: DUF2281 domain-containing protein [Pyrinomonadaceae bacterium]|jgi:hypothetical protein